MDDGDLVLRTRGRTRRLPVGGDGITRAVFVDVPGADQERVGPAIRGSWGELQLQDRDGALVARFDLEDWLPESPALPKRSVQGSRLLGRTGVAALLTTAGIPLHVTAGRDDPLVARPSGRHLGPGRAFPLWYLVTRAAAGGIWFTAFTVIVFYGATTAWLVLLLAAAALVAPVARWALRAWTRLRLRRCRPVVRERVGPAPAAGLGATVRFCRDTELRVQDRDLVVRELGGREYWLPLTGPHAVRTLVLVRDRAGEALGVELRGAEDQVRAVLPWRLWFGGERGADGWARLRRSTGLPVTERRPSGRADWPKSPALGTGLLPGSGRVARGRSRFPGTIAGLSSTAVMAFGSYFSIAQGLRIAEPHPAAGAAATAMGALGLALQAVPYGAHQLHSRLRLDRPAPQQTPTE
ncbi:hypothetical protein ACGFS9_22340 [Streptomyces sp. NPDC048566]|uniref:hypothetical protein n=1 Tax=Streptomyces sp. NPDC048566 TaxID=3365569 RepID=UPI00372118AF